MKKPPRVSPELRAAFKALSGFFAEAGRAGGKARAENLTPQQRKQIAKKAAKARWEKYRKEKGNDTR